MIPAWVHAARTGGHRRASMMLSVVLCGTLLQTSPVAFTEDAADLDQAAERIILSLKPIHGNIDVTRSGRCGFRIDREFSGELATHQQVTLNLEAVTYARPGTTLGPKRNDETYREIAKHRPHAVFFGNSQGATVAHTETWFDPNPFKLRRSFVDEPAFELYAESAAEMDTLVRAVMALAAACRPVC